MRKEFWFWVIDAIENRAQRLNNPLSSEQRRHLLNKIQEFSDKDYESVSNELTSAIEKELVLFGFSSTDAIRLSWKWSD